MRYQFRKATSADVPRIWEILQQAIEQRKKDGSKQWQDGYPNPEIVKSDTENGTGYVLTENDVVIGYSAVIFNDEPVYDKIKGRWLTTDTYVVVHRVAVATPRLRKGMAKKIFAFIEEIALQHDIYSIKVDTNFDNAAMLRIFEQLNFVYCGKVYFRTRERLAYEKVLEKR